MDRAHFQLDSVEADKLLRESGSVILPRRLGLKRDGKPLQHQNKSQCAVGPYRINFQNSEEDSEGTANAPFLPTL